MPKGYEPYNRDTGAVNYYPSPFFDLARLYMPNNIKEMFKWCRFYYYTHPIVNQVITRLTEYPITDFIVEADDRQTMDKYQDILRSLKMRSFLIQYGMDYYTYGNSFVSIYFPFTRFLRCACKQQVNIKSCDYKIRNFTPYGKCKKCGKETSFSVHDVSLKDTKRIRLVRWNPLNVQMEHNEISGETFYYLAIPGRVQRGIISGQPVYWETTPVPFIKAIKEQKWLRFKDDKIFHFKRPSLADENMEWGKPLVLPVLREIFHLYTLRKAQESIAIDRIISLRYLFPMQQTANIEPAFHIDMGKWRDRIEEEVKKWKQDPLYISIMPVPLGTNSIGGEGKALMVYPEMEATSKMIENGLGMPSGFMSGQITYSGGNVVLRMMENALITYRDLLEEFSQWVVDNISIYLGMKRVKVRMKEFKMGDDMVKKQILQGLNAAGKLSDDTFFSEFDLDSEREMEKILQEGADRQKKGIEARIDLMSTIQGYVAQISEMEQPVRDHVLAQMAREMPETYELIANKIGNNGNRGGNGHEDRVRPEKEPVSGGLNAN